MRTFVEALLVGGALIIARAWWAAEDELHELRTEHAKIQARLCNVQDERAALRMELTLREAHEPIRFARIDSENKATQLYIRDVLYVRADSITADMVPPPTEEA